jgi:hypothetical protein
LNRGHIVDGLGRGEGDPDIFRVVGEALEDDVEERAVL